MDPKAFALTVAALLALVGFQGAVAQPLAVNPLDSTIALTREGADGGDGLVATEELGGDLLAPFPPPFLEIIVAADSVTLTAIVAMDSFGGLVLVEITATTEYYAYDALGNVRVVMSSSGARLNTLAYRPFGICAYGCASEPKYAYTGEYRESAPNLVYLHSRWYDPTIGRFLSPDDRLGSLSAPQTQNRYVYVGNNPLKYTDPTGHELVGALIGAAFGFVLGYGICALTGGTDCLRVAVIGMIAGAIAGATFNVLVGMQAFTALGGGLGTSVAAGAAAGALGGALNFAMSGAVATAMGEDYDWSVEHFATEVIFGAVVGGVLAGAFYGAGKAITAWRSAVAKGKTAVEVANELQDIADEVARDFDNGLLGPAPGRQPAQLGRGNVIHAEVAQRAARAGLPVEYSRVGPDFRYTGNSGGQTVRFEVTTPGQVGRHVSRFAKQGYGNDIFFFILY